MSKDHKKVDENCMSLTASFIRAKHEMDPSVPVCDYYEVCVCWLLGYSRHFISLQNFNTAQLKMNEVLLPQGIYNLVSFTADCYIRV